MLDESVINPKDWEDAKRYYAKMPRKVYLNCESTKYEDAVAVYYQNDNKDLETADKNPIDFIK